MALAKTRFDKDLQAARRQRLLANALIAGELTDMSLRDIAQNLADAKGAKRSCNAEGQPWSHETIRNDLEQIQTGWQAESSKDLAIHKSNVLRRLDALWATAFEKGENNVKWMSEARNVIALKIKLLGLDSEDVRIYESINDVMNKAIDRFELAYKDDPEELKKVLAVLFGKEPRALN